MPTERRPLRSVPFVGHNYRVEPEILVTEFVEKEAKVSNYVLDLRVMFQVVASLLAPIMMSAYSFCAGIFLKLHYAN